jgi:hypothetical protein
VPDPAPTVGGVDVPGDLVGCTSPIAEYAPYRRRSNRTDRYLRACCLGWCYSLWDESLPHYLTPAWNGIRSRERPLAGGAHPPSSADDPDDQKPPLTWEFAESNRHLCAANTAPTTAPNDRGPQALRDCDVVAAGRRGETEMVRIGRNPLSHKGISGGRYWDRTSDLCRVNADPIPPVMNGHHRSLRAGGILTTGCPRSSTAIAGCHVVAVWPRLNLSARTTTSPPTPCGDLCRSPAPQSLRWTW